MNWEESTLMRIYSERSGTEVLKDPTVCEHRCESYPGKFFYYAPSFYTENMLHFFLSIVPRQ